MLPGSSFLVIVAWLGRLACASGNGQVLLRLSYTYPNPVMSLLIPSLIMVTKGVEVEFSWSYIFVRPLGCPDPTLRVGTAMSHSEALRRLTYERTWT